MGRRNRIYIDGLVLAEEHYSGIGQYVAGIVDGIDNLISSDDKYKKLKVFVLVGYDRAGLAKSRLHLNKVKIKRLPVPFRVLTKLKEYDLTPIYDLFFWRGVFLFPHFVAGRLIKAPSINIIYDLTYKVVSEFVEDRNAMVLDKLVSKSVKRVSLIGTISENSKKDIENAYKPDKKIEVFYPSVNEAFIEKKPESDIEVARKKYAIPKKYILYLGNLEPRKNLESVLKSYTALPKQLRDQYSLLLVGANGWKIEGLLKDIDDYIKQGYKIVRPNKYVEDKDKAAIISGAELLFYIPHFEGFGIPPIEALACGVPVLVSDNSSLPEAVGDAAAGMVDSRDVGRVTAELTKVLKNIKKHQEDAKKRGPAQAAKFSHDKSAKELVDAFVEIGLKL